MKTAVKAFCLSDTQHEAEGLRVIPCAGSARSSDPLDTVHAAADTDRAMKKQFDQLQASVLFCNKCERAMPVRQRLLLFLPDGELYDYLCQGCGSSVGSKTDRAAANQSPKGLFPRSS